MPNARSRIDILAVEKVFRSGPATCFYFTVLYCAAVNEQPCNHDDDVQAVTKMRRQMERNLLT